MEPHYYHVNVTWEQDRRGVMSSPELDTSIVVATPPQFAKGIPGIWSPEHLYTAAASSCLMTTFLAIAEMSKLEFAGFACASEGKLEQVDGKFLMTEVKLKPELTIANEKDRERAERILQKSEAACLISNSMKAKVTMEPVIKVAAEVNS